MARDGTVQVAVQRREERAHRGSVPLEQHPELLGQQFDPAPAELIDFRVIEWHI
jgi:hypothetical protein